MANRVFFMVGFRHSKRTAMIVLRPVPPPIRGPWTLHGVVAGKTKSTLKMPPHRKMAH